MPLMKDQKGIKTMKTKTKYMVTRQLLTITLDIMIGKTRFVGRASGKTTMAQIAQSLTVYVDRQELNLNLDGEALYKNAKECLELAGYEVEP